MHSTNKLVVTVLFLGISLTSVSCLMCHVCSTSNPGEEDCFTIAEDNTKYLVNCTAPKNNSCRTQEQWVDFQVLKQGHDKRTVRQCASTEYDPDRPCYYRTGFGGKVSVCNCAEDACNDAIRTVSTALLTAAAFLILKMLV